MASVIANDAYGDCLSKGFTQDQCGSFDRCVQINSRYVPPIQICQPNAYGGFDCDGGTMSDPFHVSGDNDPYWSAEVDCYQSLGAPPFPVTEEPPLPPEEPPFDPYKCHCPAHKPNPLLIMLSGHPVLGMLLGAVTVLVLFGFVQALV